MQQTKTTLQDLQEQLARYQQFLLMDPENPQLIGEVAELQTRLGDFNAARSTLAAASTSGDMNPGLVFKLATVELASGNPDVALPLLESLKAMGINEPGVDYNLAYAQVLSRDYTVARDSLEALLDAYEEPLPQTKILLARVMHHLDGIDAGLQHLDDFVQLQPDNAEALGLQSLMLWDNDDSEAAQVAAEHALKFDQGNPEANLALGSIALEQQVPDAALRHFRRITDKQPNNGRAWSGLAYAELLNIEIDKAQACFQRAVECMPDHIGTWHGLAWVQLLKDDFNGAEASFNKAMDIDHNFADTHGGLAVVAVMRGDHDNAELLAKRALRLDGTSFAGWFARSLLQGKKGNNQAGKKILRQLVAAPQLHGERRLGELTKTLMIRKYGEEAGELQDIETILASKDEENIKPSTKVQAGDVEHDK